MTGRQVLIVEDNQELRNVLARGLEEEGFDSGGVGTAAEAVERVASSPPDVLVIDIGLPDADGRDLCQALRAGGLQAPVLFLTARDAVVDRLGGFEAGGDDYVTKPFEFEEVVARLNALLRRAGVDGAQELGGMRLDPVTHSASAGDRSVDLTPTEFRLLARLLANPGEAVRRRQLVYAAWPHGAVVHDNTLDVYIARLRNKLRTLPRAPVIVTVHGVGYAVK